MAEHPLHLARRAGATRRVSARLGAPFPGAVLAVAAAAGVVLLLGPAVGSAAAVATATGLFAMGAATMLATLPTTYPHAEFGPANAVTLLRLALVAVLACALIDTRGPSAWTLTALATFCLVLDGMDGWLARRTGLVSRFGARFDMEVDCLLALVLALLVLESGKVGVWVLALGAARYLFWGASLILPWLSGPLPDRWSRKAVCVLQIVVLVALVSPAVDGMRAPWLAMATAGLVAWSFAVDIRHLARARP